MDTRPITVGLLEPEQLLAECLGSFLERAGFDVVTRCPSVDDFLARIRQRPPDVALVALWPERPGQPIVSDGFRALGLLHDFFPQVRPLVLSASREEDLIGRCFRAGASGYLCKLTVSCAEVVQALQRVARGERVLPASAALLLDGLVKETPAFAPLARLTPREREVLGYIATGADNLKIAACLGITERTVKAHITSIYRKLDVENRPQMAMLACQLGVERPP
jgi:DNA-binding NarL/FixJ family response regulator